MFTKKDLDEIILETQSGFNSNKILSISTSIGTNLGLNGIDYKTFEIGKLITYYDDGRINNIKKYEISLVKENYLVIKLTFENYMLRNQLKEKRNSIIYLPYESINSISLVSPYDKRGNYSLEKYK